MKNEKIKKIAAWDWFVRALFFAFFFSTAILIDVKHWRLKLIAMELGALSFLTVFLALSVIKGKVRILKNKLDIWIFAYFLYVILRYLFMQNKAVSRMEIEKSFLCLGLYIGVSQILLKQNIKFILKIFSFSAILIAIYGLWQNFGTPFFCFRVPKISPPFATFGNRNFFAAYLVLTFPLLGLLITEKNFFVRISGILGFFVYLLDFYYIKSRAGILSGTLEILLFSVFFLKQKLPPFKFKKIVITVGIISILAGSVLIYAKKDFWLRDINRIYIWADTIKMGVRNPFGVGPGGFTSNFPKYASQKLKKIYPPSKYIVNFAHNEYLEIFSELGFLGIFLFLAIIFTFFKNCKDVYLIVPSAGILFSNLFSVNMRFIVYAGFLYFYFAVFRTQNSQRKTIYLGTIPRIFISLFTAGLLYYFIPKIFEPIKAIETISKEKSFYEKVDDEKIKKLMEKAKKNPDHKTFNELGWLFAKRKNYSRAVNYFLKAAQIKPQAGTWNNIGNIFFETGQRQKAIEAYRKAIEINPNLVDAHFNMGYTYFYMGKLPQAAKCFEEVLKRDPSNVKAKVMLEKMKE
ncbi:MAG: tetratricopeptide repeat protein [Elusimicrobia bacterium]|nr:tetratricopeptide repeat protein [Elusimicrobiota bacterium]